MRYGIERYFILGAVLAFLGWLWETALMFALTGEYYDRGFMTLPFCPIYATGILGAYFLLGTPKERTRERDICCTLLFVLSFQR